MGGGVALTKHLSGRNLPEHFKSLQTRRIEDSVVQIIAFCASTIPSYVATRIMDFLLEGNVREKKEERRGRGDRREMEI